MRSGSFTKRAPRRQRDLFSTRRAASATRSRRSCSMPTTSAPAFVALPPTRYSPAPCPGCGNSARSLRSHRTRRRGRNGEVYRARDSRLGRDVAIKALPESLAHDAERLARFEREARLLASLNHPNIASIYGLEEVAGQRYLVLEYVEGETPRPAPREGSTIDRRDAARVPRDRGRGRGGARGRSRSSRSRSRAT